MYYKPSSGLAASKFGGNFVVFASPCGYTFNVDGRTRRLLEAAMRTKADDRPKIVVIDDEGDFLTLMEHSLKGLYQVTSLYGSEWTYAQVAALEPDLILLDVHMPEEGGFDICRELRADPRFVSTPIIFLTGSQRAEDFKRHLKAGGTRFLLKGIGRAQLLAALGEALAASKRRMLPETPAPYEHDRAHSVRG